MPKLKTNRSIAKRFKITKKGKIKCAKAFKGHLLTGKSRKRKRALSKKTILSAVISKKLKARMSH